MGWKETRVQDERVLLVERFAAQELSRAEICRGFGVSRKTGYKWYEQYLLEESPGWRTGPDARIISRKPSTKRRSERFLGPDLGIQAGASASCTLGC